MLRRPLYRQEFKFRTVIYVTTNLIPNNPLLTNSAQPFTGTSLFPCSPTQGYFRAVPHKSISVRPKQVYFRAVPHKSISVQSVTGTSLRCPEPGRVKFLRVHCTQLGADSPNQCFPGQFWILSTLARTARTAQSGQAENLSQVTRDQSKL